MSMTATVCTRGKVVMANAKYREETLKSAGAQTILEGTLLARDSTDNKLVVMVVAGANNTGVPVAVAGYAITKPDATDMIIQPVVGGEVRKDKLIIHADANGTNITIVHLDNLRDYGILANVNKDVSVLDNT